ncbi:MAG: glutamate 5-kinase, partial [Acidobacteria bacterium]|nr:glutamate 5-kinase [Acidobacteriota bacterium]
MTGYPYRRIVVKCGTSSLTAGTPNLSLPRIVDLVRQMAHLADAGLQVLLVSSGAIMAGREQLGFPTLPKGIPKRQMLASIGQPRLMSLYAQLFGIYGRSVSQVLLTRHDFQHRRSYLNARNTLTALLDHAVIPVINENDTTATEEIRVGDNDNLSAMVANLVDADLLAMLTDQPGLFTADPRSSPSARLLTEIREAEIPAEVWAAAGTTAGALGTGGMLTKLQAADLVRRSGTTTVIARGSDQDIILRIARAEAVGTRFAAVASALESRKRFIISGWNGKCRIEVDPGVGRALMNGGSLLPVGVVNIVGEFDRGDTVAVFACDGRELARGVVNYHADELARIRGKRSDQIESTLGYAY